MMLLPRLLIVLAFAPVLLASAASGLTASAAPHYTMTVDLGSTEGRILVEGEVRVPAADADQTELVFSLNRAFRDVRFEIISPRSGPVTVSERGGFTDYAVRPAHPFPARRQIVVRFSYRFDPDTPVSYFYAGADGAFASGVNVAWYPQLAGRPPHGVGRVRFLLPRYSDVVVNGPQGVRSRVRRGPQASFSFLTPTAFSFVAGRFHQYTGPNNASVRVLLLSPRSHGAEYARNVRRIIDYYAREFASYPFGSFAVVEVPEAGADRSGFTGQSESGMIWVTPRYLTRVFSNAYYGHEVGHQWWGQFVSKDVDAQSGFYMPDEALAQWGALQIVAAFEGEAAAERFRRTGYPAYSSLQNGLGYLTLVEAGEDEIIDAPRAPRSHLIANSKGFLVLDHLADTIGRERFRAALRRVLSEHANSSISWVDLKAALEADSGQDISWFMQQWFARPGAPDWSLQWRQERASVTGAITQEAPHYRARLEVEATGVCGVRTISVEVQGPNTPFTIDMPCLADSVALDPHYRVLRWTPAFHALARVHAPFARWAIGDYPAAQSDIASLLADVPTPDPDGIAFQLHYDLARILQYENAWPQALTEWRAAVAAPSAPRDELPMAFVGLARAARQTDDIVAMQAAADEAQRTDALASAPTGAVDAVAEIEDET